MSSDANRADLRTRVLRQIEAFFQRASDADARLSAEDLVGLFGSDPDTEVRTALRELSEGGYVQGVNVAELAHPVLITGMTDRGRRFLAERREQEVQQNSAPRKTHRILAVASFIVAVLTLLAAVVGVVHAMLTSSDGLPSRQDDVASAEGLEACAEGSESGDLLTQLPVTAEALSDQAPTTEISTGNAPWEMLEGLNHTQVGDCSGCWRPDTVYAEVGDVVSLEVFYNVSGDADALNTVVHLSAEPSTSESIVVTARVWAANAPMVWDSISVVVPTGQRIIGLEHTGYTTWWDGFAGQHTLPYNQRVNQVMKASGLNLGTTRVGDSNSRFLLTRFCVVGERSL